MLNSIIQGPQVSRVFSMLTAFTGVRITLYDAADEHLAEFDVQPDSAYCRRQRRHAGFATKCLACDHAHLRQARQTGRPLTYRCHHGLTEGIVPLYDGEAKYLGAIVFGQVRASGNAPCQDRDPVARRLYRSLPVYTPENVANLTGLLECLGHYLVQTQVIRLGQALWLDTVRQHIQDHLQGKITVAHLAAATGRSASFITHRFKAATGLSTGNYIKRERMRRASAMLAAGTPVKAVAFELGYWDESHFSKAFKLWHGYPPSQETRAGRASHDANVVA